MNGHFSLSIRLPTPLTCSLPPNHTKPYILIMIPQVETMYTRHIHLYFDVEIGWNPLSFYSHLWKAFFSPEAVLAKITLCRHFLCMGSFLSPIFSLGLSSNPFQCYLIHLIQVCSIWEGMNQHELPPPAVKLFFLMTLLLWMQEQ